MPRLVKFNNQGRRIGESHPCAVLSDHEVDLLWEMLEEREALIARLELAGAARMVIDAELTARGLSYRLLAAKFEVHKRYIGRIANGERRCQPVAKSKPCP